MVAAMSLARPLDVAFRIAAALMLIAVVGGASACAVLLPVARDATGPQASPPVLGALGDDPPVGDVAAWRERRAPRLKAAFEAEVYGRMPPPAPVRVLARKPIPYPELEALGRLEQITLALGDVARTNVLLMTPVSGGPRPLVLMQSFCGNRAAVPGWPAEIDLLAPPPGPCLNTTADRLVRLVFGRHANAPPWPELARRGYAAATFYAGDIVPDDAESAPAALARLQPGVPADERGAALAAWAWSYSRVLETLEREPGVDPARTAVWGHSRNGKSALLAAAFDPRIDLVIAHQSGRGGAALSRSPRGESVAEITGSFPHWFAPRYASHASREGDMPVDQHQLIALIAPRPVLLGAARRDAWADPAGALAALRGAQPAYALNGSAGLTQSGLSEPDLDADLATFMRPGRHGVQASDWAMFLAFLDAHFGADRPSGAP